MKICRWELCAESQTQRLSEVSFSNIHVSRFVAWYVLPFYVGDNVCDQRVTYLSKAQAKEYNE